MNNSHGFREKQIFQNLVNDPGRVATSGDENGLEPRGRGRPETFPVPLKTYDESIAVLRCSLDRAKLDGGAKVDGFRRLDRFVKLVEEQMEPRADFDAVLQHERAISPALGGRTVFDDKNSGREAGPRQMRLWTE